MPSIASSRPRPYVAKPAGQWNDVHITCLGDHVSVAVNGQQITEASMAEHESLRDRPREGYIGLSAHTPASSGFVTCGCDS